jgi:adenylate cyclase
MPKPINDIALAVLRSPPRAVAGTVSRTTATSAVSETRKIAAILVSDGVGYRLAGVDEDLTLARLRALRSDLIDPTISVHHGRIVKRTGDGSPYRVWQRLRRHELSHRYAERLIERSAGLSRERRNEFRVGVHPGNVVTSKPARLPPRLHLTR